MYREEAYCGLYCGACPVFHANQKGTLDQKAAEWKTDVEKIVCHGCKSDKLCYFCHDCSMKTCAESKNLDFCGDCEDFPCKHISDLQSDDRPHHSVIVKNLLDIKSRGLNTWLTDQRKRWACPKCHAAFSWYEKQCSQCGSELFDCIAEEKTLMNPS